MKTIAPPTWLTPKAEEDMRVDLELHGFEDVRLDGLGAFNVLAVSARDTQSKRTYRTAAHDYEAHLVTDRLLKARKGKTT